MNSWQEMPDWEKALYILTEECINEDRFNILNLYLKLSNSAADWILSNKYGIIETDIFQVPCEDGNTLKFTFYKDTTELELINQTNSKTNILISKEASAKKEYAVINSMSTYFLMKQQGLGVPAPRNMYSLCQNLKKGETITFEGKNTYCCLNNKDGYLTLLKTFTGNINDLSLNTFNKMQKITIDYSTDAGRQDFFSQNRITSSGAIVTKITSDSKAQDYINNLYSNLQPGKTKKLKWGPIDILVRRKRIGKGLVWYADGVKIDESVAKTMLGYFKNAPLETEFVRTNLDLIDKFNDLKCLESIKQLCAQTDFANIYTQLLDYVSKNGQSLSVNLKTFAPDKDGNYLSQGFSFQEIDGQVKVFSLNYEDNDFSNDITEMKEVSIEEFVSFCNKINEQNKTYFLKEAEDEIKQVYNIETLNNTQTQVVKAYAEKKRIQNPIIDNKNLRKNTLEDLIQGFSAEQEDKNHERINIKEFFNDER